jgi:hypothetical protein
MRGMEEFEPLFVEDRAIEAFLEDIQSCAR